ncbi:MAG: DUF503 domain-containing protein [Firmicutes bacterium]|jgi:uncharacterized protein YlxP (DUF503 family)|nr:DUF503 domain-containing protein [Bacillota bacterium]
MIVGLCRLELFIGEADSLKDKRRILLSLIERLKRRFNISIAEVGYQEIRQRGELALALVGNEKHYLETVLQKILNYVENDTRLEILKIHVEYL